MYSIAVLRMQCTVSRYYACNVQYRGITHAMYSIAVLRSHQTQHATYSSEEKRYLLGLGGNLEVVRPLNVQENSVVET